MERFQEDLDALGYYPGEPDGSFGANTLRAVRQFQQDRIESLQSSRELAPALARNELNRQITALREEIDTDRAGEETLSQLERELAEADVDSGFDLQQLIPDLGQRSDKDKQKLVEDIDRLANGSEDEQFSAALSLAGQLNQTQVRELARELGVSNRQVARLIGNGDAFEAAAVLVDPDSSTIELFGAAFDLASAYGDVADGKLGDQLRPYFRGAAAGASLIDFIDTWGDPEASAIDKLSAAVDFAADARQLQKVFPERFERILGKSGGLFTLTSAALTLIDPDASVQEKAAALVDVKRTLPKVTDDIDAIKNILRGHVDAGDLNRIFEGLPAHHRLPSVLSDALDDDVLQRLTQQDVDALLKVADNLGDEVGEEGGEVLARVLGKLDYEGIRNFSKFAGQLDGAALDLFVKTADAIDARLLSRTLDTLKIADSGFVKSLSEMLNVTAGILDSAGVKVTREVAEKLAKAFGRAIPIAGAAVAAYSVVELGLKAKDSDLPDDLRYFALTGSKLNATDAVWSILEPFLSLPSAGLAVVADIALAGATLAVDLILAHEEGKLAEQGDNYEAPAWIGHANVAVALGSGDLPLFFSIYGRDDGIAQITESIGAAGAAAEAAAEQLLALADQQVAEAQQVLEHLLIGGGVAADRVIGLLGDIDLGEGLQDVIGALADADERGREVLAELSDAGVGFAKNVLGGIGDFFEDQVFGRFSFN